jgi:twitching motility protein PilT
MMTREQWEYFDRTGALCFAYAFEGGGRFRASAFKHRGGCDAALRVIAEQLPPLEQLGLYEGCARLAQLTDGLVLFASPAGSGKTTTMMALVNQINTTRRSHIVTLEDPIEYLLLPLNSRVTQREIGTHAATFETAFQAALREDPDVLVFGELRDEETTGVALQAASAGLLVLATVQALDCSRAIDRLLESSAAPQRRRDLLADNLRAVFGQQLIRRASGQGRAAACEMLVSSVSVGNIIRDGKTHNLVNIMQTGRTQGMLMLDDSLRALLDQKIISAEEAWQRARNKAGLKHTPSKESKTEAP